MSTSDQLTARNGKSDHGLSLVETVAAMAVLAIASLGAVSSLLMTAGVDEALRERTIALRAATSRMESILAYDYGDDINNLVTHLAQPEETFFQVAGLSSPELTDLSLAAQAKVPLGETPQSGQVEVDATDPQRIRATIRVNWRSRSGEARSVNLPMTISAVERQ